MSHHRIGAARNQIVFNCLDDLIAEDNIVRVIDAFVDILDFQQLGFAHIQPKKTGSPPYHPALMMRIYLYGYLNRVRSSRKLETECSRNVEMQWLCGRQIPSYHTIATFRTFKSDDGFINHRNGLKEVFRAFNRFLNGQDLFGKETVATDGSKFRAQNAKKKNYTEDKLIKKIELADANIAQYLDDLDHLDASEDISPEQTELKEFTKLKLLDAQKWKDKYVAFKDELKRRQAEDPDITQISTTDPDARSIVLNNSGHAEVSYNIVTSVDEKHKLIVNFFTDNIKDTTLLSESLIAAKAELDNDFHPDLHLTDENLSQNTENTEGVLHADLTQKLNPNTTLNGLADKGFHAATQLHECASNNIITYVSVPKPAYSGKDKNFTVEHFHYNLADDSFTCPNQKTLTSNGVFYEKKNRRGVVTNRYKRYNMSPKDCAACPFAAKCLSKTALKNRVSRQIERAECQQAAVENKQRMDSVSGKKIYQQRQGIVEHPFGIIKRQWDCSYTLVRRMDKVNGEFAIVFTCYNLRRAVSILSVKTLVDRLKTLKIELIGLFYPFFIAFLSYCGFLNPNFRQIHRVA